MLAAESAGNDIATIWVDGVEYATSTDGSSTTPLGRAKYEGQSTVTFFFDDVGFDDADQMGASAGCGGGGQRKAMVVGE